MRNRFPWAIMWEGDEARVKMTQFGWPMLLANFRECQRSALDGKQRRGSCRNPHYSALPSIERQVGKDHERMVGKPSPIDKVRFARNLGVVEGMSYL